MVIPMYKELVNKLYHCANEVFCNKCYYSPDCAGEKTIIREAADAIEDLEKSLAIALLEYQMANNKLLMTEEYAKQKNRWIPAAERLPEEPYGCLAIVWDNPRYGGGDCFLNYYPEYIGYDGTWNDANGEEIPLEVVYWMKMPEIPEEPESEDKP